MSTKTMEQFNTTLVTSFVKSVKNVLTTMAGLDCQFDTPALKGNSCPTHDVSGLVGFSGDVAGTVVVSFCAETASNVVEAFVGERVEQSNADFVDAIGELCNMIAGNAKKDFGLDTRIGIPSVIVGSGHSIAMLRDVPCVVVPCTSDMGDFTIEINIKQVAQTTEGR